MTQHRLRSVIIGGLYVSGLFPLFFTSETMYPWLFGKTILFQMLVELVFVLAVVYWYRERPDRLKLHWLDILFGLFLLAQITSTITSSHVERSFWGNQTRLNGVFTWLHVFVWYGLLRAFLKTREQWRWWLGWLTAIGVISAILAWVGPSLSVFEGVIAPGSRRGGLIGNPLFLAGYVLLPIFFSLILYLQTQKKNQKYVWGSIGIFLCITVLGTQIRSAFVGLLAAVVVGWLLLIVFVLKDKQRKALVGVGAICVVLVLGLYVWNQQSRWLRVNVPVMGRLLDITPKETTGQTRLLAWNIAVAGWKERPLLGWGPDTFQEVFDRHYNPTFLKYSFAETVWDKPHNYFLEVLSTVGLVGFIPYAGFFILAGILLVRQMKRGDQGQQKEIMVLAGALIAYAGFNFFAFDTVNSLMLFVVLLAYIVYSTEPNGVVVVIMPLQARRFLVGVGALVLIGIGAVPYAALMNYRMYVSSVRMSDARDAVPERAAAAWKQRALLVTGYPTPIQWEQSIFLIQDMSNLAVGSVLTPAIVAEVGPEIVEIAEKRVERHPASYAAHFWLGEVYGFMAEKVDEKYYQDANDHLKKAGELSPGQQRIPFLLAKNYLLQGRTDEGIQLLEEAVRANPEYPESHWFLGLALVEKGAIDRGIAELEKGAPFGLTFVNNITYMVDLYAKRKEYAKIVPLYERLIVMEPKNPRWYSSLAATYAALKDVEQTILYLNKAVALDPSLAPEAAAFLKQNNIDISQFQS